MKLHVNHLAFTVVVTQVLLILGMASSGHAYAAPDLAQVNGLPLEVVDPLTKVSARPVPGLTFFEQNDSIWQDSKKRNLAPLYAYVRGDIGRVAVTMTTVDGRYEYEAENIVPGGRDRWVQIELSQEHTNFLARESYRDYEIAVLVSAKTSDRFAPFPIRWRQPSPTQRLQLQYKAGDYIASVGGGVCERLESGKRHLFRFDNVCMLNSGSKVWITKSKGRRVGDSFGFTLQLPPEAQVP